MRYAHDTHSFWFASFVVHLSGAPTTHFIFTANAHLLRIRRVAHPSMQDYLPFFFVPLPYLLNRAFYPISRIGVSHVYVAASHLSAIFVFLDMSLFIAARTRLAFYGVRSNLYISTPSFYPTQLTPATSGFSFEPCSALPVPPRLSGTQ